MDLRQLEYFREIADTGSINEAARRLNMSQPPLSYQLRQLEDELSVRLLDRSSHGVALTEAGKAWLHLSNQAAGTFCSTMLVFLTALLTGIGVFDRIGQYAGAGAFVPISGFANAMVSPAMEYRREGMVLGIGAKLFTIAGPVLVWGVSASVLVGIVYALFPW